MKPEKNQDRYFLPFSRPFIGEEEITEVADALRSGWITTGPRTKRFQDYFRRYAGSSHALGVTSCTAAMHLSLIAMGIGAGDEVITSPITFPATANIVVHCGATPVFVDVEPETLNMDVSLLESALSPSTRAIIPVHFAGRPVDMQTVLDIAQQRGFAVVEDAAHALESWYRGSKIGSGYPELGKWSFKWSCCFSFYATKNITTGEGGMVTTNDEGLADEMEVLSLHGISRDAWKRYSEEGYRHWETIRAGFKYNMTDIQAALGLVQLRKVERLWKVRTELFSVYDEAIEGLDEVVPLKREVPEGRHAHHLYVILFRDEMLDTTRDVIMNEIQARGVGIGIHFRALHLHPFYRDRFGFRPGLFPVAEDASRRILSLPLYPGMSKEDVERAAGVLRDVVRSHRR
ncbi:MAG: DegT/DnrJ/EryC1/StrS aminotransferase family protein [Deltaproteobacteria bacterium]|nr:DegT/DnrJ/EryC1/StrS aminotransferase family protein [Deltaproteobacteria bacterium]MBW2307536.1 DegT/DnrJ/EryC1/StrS aminotransferase family protein [Deltaproteobacteria bacterium]